MVQAADPNLPRTHAPDFPFSEVESVEELVDGAHVENVEHGLQSLKWEVGFERIVHRNPLRGHKNTVSYETRVQIPRFDLGNQIQITVELLFVDFEGELHNQVL